MAAPARAESATREEYLRLHRLICLSKALDDRMHTLVKQGRAPSVGSARGHEGIQVAAAAALDGANDWLVPHYRGLGSAVTRGLTAREWMLAVFAKAGDPLTAGRNIPGGYFGSSQLRIRECVAGGRELDPEGGRDRLRVKAQGRRRCDVVHLRRRLDLERRFPRGDEFRRHPQAARRFRL